MIKPVLKYPGAKWRIADWICSHLPPHEVYVEPFFGSGAVFFRKEPARLETINDLDGDVVNLFRVMRDKPAELASAVELTPWAREELENCIGFRCEADEVERARRMLVWVWQQIGRRTDSDAVNGWRWTKVAASNPTLAWRGLPDRILAAAQRLRRTQIERRPALDVIRANAAADVLVYADPPYIRATRSRNLYRHEMSDADHADLLAALSAHPGPALVSGYEHPLYSDALGASGWRCVRRTACAEGGLQREEVLWINPVAARCLGERLFA